MGSKDQIISALVRAVLVSNAFVKCSELIIHIREIRWRQRTPKDSLRSLRSAYEEAIYAEVVVFFVVVFFAGFFVVMVSEVVREGCRANSARDAAASRGFSDAFSTK